MSADWVSPEYLDRLLDDVAAFPLDDLIAEIAAWEPEPYQPLDLPPYEPIDREPYPPIDVPPLPDLDTD